MIVIVLEPEGAWRCNECTEFVEDPVEHAGVVHNVHDKVDLVLVHTDDI